MTKPTRILFSALAAMTLGAIVGYMRDQRATIKRAEEQLTARVGEQTRELEAVVKKLEAEILERQRAEQALRHSAEQVQRRADQLAMLNEVGHAVSTLRDVGDVLETIYQQVKLSLPLDMFFVGLYDAETHQISFPIMYDGGERWDETTPRPLTAGSFSGQVIRSGQPLRLNQSAETIAASPVPPNVIGETTRISASLMFAPLPAGERIIGVISAQSYTLNAYGEDDLELLLGIAYQAASAIQNARSYSAAQQELAERQRIEAQLRISEERYRLISAVSSDYTFSTLRDAQGKMSLNWVAGAFEAITGYSFEEYKAHGEWLAALHPADIEQDARDMEHLRARQPVTTEVRTITKNGAVRWVRVYAHPVWNEIENQLTGIYGAVQDVTERKRVEAEREALIAELEAKNAELERFTYTVSHDLKSPLVTIRGFLGYMEKDAAAGDQNRFKADMNRIIEATDKMQRLLTELLELSRIGRMMNPPQAAPFEMIAREAVGLVRGRIEACGGLVTIEPGLPLVHGDRVRLVEVVQNLVDNACKFMGGQPEPHITIGHKGTEPEGWPIVFVRDNGIGIDPQYHDQVFGLFNKLDAQSEGTGVGLALVKRIVEVHGGRIWVESAGLNCGSTFCFTLPEPPPTTEKSDGDE